MRTTSELELITRKIKNKRRITMNLIYKASCDSDTAEAFHKKCDKAKASIVLVETRNEKRFGGYTSQSWSGDCEDKFDNDAFIFSLDKNKTYDVIQNKPAIGCYPEFGPIFFGWQNRIFDRAFIQGGSTYKRMRNYETEKDYELTDGDQSFDIRDIEVYEVLL